MKSIASALSIIILGFGLLGCPGSGGGGSGGGGGTPAAFAVSTTAADFGVVGNAYTSTLAVTGGTAPFTWTQSGGVPTGLSLAAGTGVVSGTPTAAGNFNATFTVLDSTGMTAIGSVLFIIHPRTDRVSVDDNGVTVSGASSNPSISDDGSLVAFVSLANFVTGVNGSQVYVHNRQTSQIEVISRDSNTTVVNEGNGASSDPVFSSDGRFVAFVSQSTNLVAGVSGQQVYLRDRQTGQTTLVSRNTAGQTASAGSNNTAPSISSDGQFIAFVSNATNLVTGVISGPQIYIRDSVNGTTSLISKDNTNPTPLAGNSSSDTPSISKDGCFVAFASASTNLGAPANQVHVRGPLAIAGCAGTEQTTLVSKDNSGNPASAGSTRPSVNGNGQFIAFVSNATNLVTGVISGPQIYIHDSVNGTTSLISKDNTNPTPLAGDSSSDTPSISRDGCFVAFVSASTNLGAPANQVHVRGPLAIAGCAGTEQTTLVSKDNSGNPANSGAGTTISPSVDGNGQFIAFSSSATNLATAPPAAPSDIYVRALP